MFTVSNQNNVYCNLNDWCKCINISCGPPLINKPHTLIVRSVLTQDM